MYTIKVSEKLEQRYIGLFGTFQTLEEAKTVLNGIAARSTNEPYTAWTDTTTVELNSPGNSQILVYTIESIKSFGELPIPVFRTEQNRYQEELKTLRKAEKDLRAQREKLKSELNSYKYIGVHRDIAFNELDNLNYRINDVVRKIKKLWSKIPH